MGSDDGDEPNQKRAKGAAGGNGAGKRGVFNNLAPKKKKATERVNSMFLGAGRDVIGPNKKGAASKGGAADEGGDELLSSLLGEIEEYANIF